MASTLGHSGAHTISCGSRPLITFRGISATLASLVFTMALCAAITMVGPGSFAARSLSTVLLCPIIWGLAMFYSYWDERAARPLLVLTSCSIALVMVILITPEPL